MKTTFLSLLFVLALSLFLFTACEEVENTSLEEPTVDQAVNQKSQYSCPKNYILDGTNCCLDENSNSICDDAEVEEVGKLDDAKATQPAKIVSKEVEEKVEETLSEEKENEEVENLDAVLWEGPLPDQTYCGNHEIDPYEKCDPSIQGQEDCRDDCLGYGKVIFADEKSTTSTTKSTKRPTSSFTPTRQNKGTCDLSSFGLTGKTYYYCDCQAGSDSDCKVGNDANEGTNTDPSNPAKSASLAYDRFNQLQAGESVAFCKGGSFDVGTKFLYNYNCQTDQRCGMLDYTPTWASGDESRPIITADPENALSFLEPGDSYEDGGYVVANINFQGVDNPNTFGLFVYNDVDDIHLCGLRLENFALATAVGASNPKAADSAGDGVSSGIELYNSEIVNNAENGWLGACNGCVIENNFFDNNGFRATAGGPLSHSIYVSASSIDMQVRGNEIYRSVHKDGLGCQGTVIVVHGQHDGLVIENNKLVEEQGTAFNGCWGIGITKAYSSPEFFRNVKIRNNQIEYVGNAPIAAPECENCVIENNNIKHNTQFAG